VTLLPILAFLTLWVALGLRAALLFVSPLGFLYFAFPVWDVLQPPLQTVTSTMVGLLTKLIGMPAVLDGNYITLPTGKLFIAEGCSGAQFLCISLAVGTLACILRGDVRGTRVFVLVIAGLLSMVFNWLRILVIAFAHLHPDMQNAMDWLGGHLVVGWWIFAVGLLLLGLILRLIPSAPYEPVTRELASRSTRNQSGNRAGLWLATSAVVTLPAIAWALPRFDSYPTEGPAISTELQKAGVELVAPDLRWSPHYPGADWEERMAFVSGEGFVIEVYTNQYHEQSQGSELISYISNLFDTSTFSPDSSHIINLRDLGGRPLPARRDTLTDSAGRFWLTMYTYLVDKDPIANGRRVQLATAIRAMYSRAPAGIIAVAVPCAETCEPRFAVVEPVFIRLLEDYRGTLYE
jgi:exosortase